MQESYEMFHGPGAPSGHEFTVLVSAEFNDLWKRIKPGKSAELLGVEHRTTRKSASYVLLLGVLKKNGTKMVLILKSGTPVPPKG